MTDNTNPDEFNLLNNVQFRFDITKLPNVNYFMQTATLPSLTLDQPIFPMAHLSNVPVPGSQLTHEPFDITFLVDQQLNNYLEIYKWMINIVYTEDREKQMSDATLHFLTGNMNTTRTIKFYDIFPTVITELTGSSDDSDTDPLTCNVTFAYKYFEIDDIKIGNM